MNKLSKKILSLVMAVALALLLTLAPTSVLAADIGLQNGTPTLTRNTTVIGFAGQEWWVIGDGSSGVSPVSGHITLLAKDNVYGKTAFRTLDNNQADQSGWTQYPTVTGDWYQGSFTAPSDYNDSTLQRKMVALAGDTTFLPAKEAALITARNI